MKNHLNTILTSTPSDSHTWNLIYMELFLQENDCHVYNLGACVPILKLEQAIEKFKPELVVISSINGHLFQDAVEIIDTIKGTYRPRFIIGGKMGISKNSTYFQKEKLKQLGYDGIFTEENSLTHFSHYLKTLQQNKVSNILKYAV